MYNYLWQGSGDGSTGRFSLVFFFHELSWFLPRSHPSLRSVRGPLWSIQRRIWWNDSIVSEMPAITRCWHYPILSGGLYWVMNAKSCDPEKFFFLFSWTFSWVVCFAVIGAFSSTASPRLTLTALIFIIASPACTPTYTRLKTHA